MPGLYSTVNRAAAYVMGHKGVGNAVRAGIGAAGAIGGISLRGMGQNAFTAGKYLAKGGFGRTAAGAFYGAAAGAGYGMMSSDTSVLGGALAGAGLGAAGARYGGAGFLSASKSGRGMGFGASMKAYGKAFGGGVSNMARRDIMSAKVGWAAGKGAANRGKSAVFGTSLRTASRGPTLASNR